MLLHLPGGQFVAFSQKCTHLSCAGLLPAGAGAAVLPVPRGRLRPVTGEPVAGPPQRRLHQIVLRRDGDMLYAVGHVP